MCACLLKNLDINTHHHYTNHHSVSPSTRGSVWTLLYGGLVITDPRSYRDRLTTTEPDNQFSASATAFATNLDDFPIRPESHDAFVAKGPTTVALVFVRHQDSCLMRILHPQFFRRQLWTLAREVCREECSWFVRLSIQRVASSMWSAN